MLPALIFLTETMRSTLEDWSFFERREKKWEDRLQRFLTPRDRKSEQAF